VLLAIDFDGVVVRQDQGYADTTTPLRFMPGAKPALYALKQAEHTLVLFSTRANRALREDPNLDPLVRAGVRKVNLKQWERERPIQQARYEQMLAFVKRELPGVFDAIDDGMCGKIVADRFIDDRALQYGNGFESVGWAQIADMYGAPLAHRQMTVPSAFKQKGAST